MSQVGILMHGRAEIPRNTKELGDRACRAHAFRPMAGRELIDNDVAPSAVSANCVTTMPSFDPMYFRKSLIIVELRQTARIVSGIEMAALAHDQAKIKQNS